MRDAYYDIKMRAPDLEIDGEMHADCALSEEIRQQIMPNSTLKGTANLLIMPTVDAANITYNARVKIWQTVFLSDPFLLGQQYSAHPDKCRDSPRHREYYGSLNGWGKIFAEDDNAALLRA